MGGGENCQGEGESVVVRAEGDRTEAAKDVQSTGEGGQKKHPAQLKNCKRS